VPVKRHSMKVNVEGIKAVLQVSRLREGHENSTQETKWNTAGMPCVEKLFQ